MTSRMCVAREVVLCTSSITSVRLRAGGRGSATVGEVKLTLRPNVHTIHHKFYVIFVHFNTI